MSSIVIHGEEWAALQEQTTALAASGYFQAAKTPAQALAIALAGRELGLSPFRALSTMHIVEGRPTMSASLMVGLALSRFPDCTWEIVEHSAKRCAILAGRPGREPVEFEFTWEDAERAGLTGRKNWRSYPKAMLLARCQTQAARAVFPDVLAGVSDPEELASSSPSQPENPTDKGAVDALASKIASAVDPAELRAIAGEIQRAAISASGRAYLRQQYGKRRTELAKDEDVASNPINEEAEPCD